MGQIRCSANAAAWHKVPKTTSRETKPRPSAAELLSVHGSAAGGGKVSAAGGNPPGQETDITFASLSIARRWWHIKYSPWRMAGERKPPETQPSFYWVMDIFSKEPSRAALLKVTELTLSTDNINGIVDVSISSFIFFRPVKSLILFFYASEAHEEWLKSTCRVSDVCCAARAQSIKV